MKLTKSIILFVFATMLFTGQVTAQSKDVQNSYANFEVQKIAEGVYAAIRKELPGLMFNANVIFIINDEDVVVVDTNITPSSAKEVLAALRNLTSKPVKYVINTHWHEDHIMGNQVYRDTFPGVEFIGHASTLVDLPTVGATNRKQLLEGAPPFIKYIRSQMEKNKSINGSDLTEEERISYLSDIKQVEQYLGEASGFQIILPTITIEDRLTLHRGSRVIDIRHLGRGHTGADLVVHLPKENILISGDLVVWPVPLVGTTSYPAEFASSLEKLLAIRPAVIVPGHGPVMRDDSYVKLLVRLLNSLKQQTEAAVSRGETLEQARKSVNLEEFRKLIAGDSQLKGYIFESYVTIPAVAAAFRQASEKK
jgi:cyclase